MKFFVQLFLLSVLCIGLSSCEDDQDVVDSTIIGRSWTGDVGMLDDFGMSVISTPPIVTGKQIGRAHV